MYLQLSQWEFLLPQRMDWEVRNCLEKFDMEQDYIVERWQYTLFGHMHIMINLF